LALGLSAEELDRLTEYSVSSRYPGDYEPIPLSEAHRAVKFARTIRRAIRKQLPKVMLRT
jgi:HEPN domain-containing protein